METPPKTKRQQLADDIRGRVKNLRNIARALYSQGVTVDKDSGTVKIGMSAAELRSLAEAESSIASLEKQAIELEDSHEDEDD